MVTRLYRAKHGVHAVAVVMVARRACARAIKL